MGQIDPHPGPLPEYRERGDGAREFDTACPRVNLNDGERHLREFRLLVLGIFLSRRKFRVLSRLRTNTNQRASGRGPGAFSLGKT